MASAALADIDGLLQEIDGSSTDEQTARIVRVLRLARDEIASLSPEDDAFVYDHGDQG